MTAADYYRLARGVEGLRVEEYQKSSAEAGRLYAARDFAGAAKLYDTLTRAYPNDGETWYLLGRSLYETGRFAEAASAFEKVDHLGVRAYISGGGAGLVDYAARFPRFAALSYARAGQMERALDWLEKALVQYHLESPQTLLGDPAFASVRGTPRYQALARRVLDPKASRVEGWRSDLDFLLAMVARTNPVYSNGRPLPAEMIAAARKLRDEIPRLSDAQVAIELQHILTLLGQSHNTLYFPYVRVAGDRASFNRLPLDFHVFPDGLYVVDAAAEYEELIGARVLRFDDTPLDQALLATRYLNDRENEMEVLDGAPVLLGIPEVLHALKVTRRPDAVTLTVVDRTGSTLTVRPKLIPNAGLQRRMQPPRLPGLGEAPLYLSRPNDPFWFEPLPAENAVYVQFNEVGRRPGETLDQFGLRLRAFLADNDVDHLIVDVRRNNGGNTYFYRELMRTLVGFDQQPGKTLYLLTARKTYSAASNFIAEVDRLTDATFVGEPSGGKPLTVGGDQTDFRLPYSGLAGGVAGTTWQLTGPRDTRRWIAPDAPVSLTAADYFSNRDPVMDHVLALVRGKARAQAPTPPATPGTLPAKRVSQEGAP